MMVTESVPLSTLTTLRVGGIARYIVRAENESEVREAIRFAEEKALPWYVIGGGSNLLVKDAGYEGVIIQLALPRVAYTEEEGGVTVIAEAGVSWDELVSSAARRELWGIENLAGIPGTCGAAPVQNIGAYGTELGDTLLWVEVLDPSTGEVARLSVEECALGYRDSRFKREPGLIIIRIALTLRKDGTPHLIYKDLVRAKEEGAVLNTPAEIGNAVRAIRAQKFPDLSREGTAGSFFKNPTVTPPEYEKLQETFPGLPGFESRAGVKLSLAWLLDKALSLKGLSVGGARLYEAQPLVIATTAGATAADVEALSDMVMASVKDATNVSIEREVRTLS